MKNLHQSVTSLSLILFLALTGLSACKNQTPSSKNSTTAKEQNDDQETQTNDQEEDSSIPNLKTSELLYAWVDQLNVRDTASMEGNVIASVDSNTALEFTGLKSGKAVTTVLRGVAYQDLWYEVQTPAGKRGWVFGGAVKRKDESKGNELITATKFSFPHFGEFDLSTWKMLETKTEGEEVDYTITTYQKGDQILEVTSSDMGEFHYGYEHRLKDQNGKMIREREFSFTGDGKLLEEKVRDHNTLTEYRRKQILDQHWYPLNAKPLMVNGRWKQRNFKQ